MQGGEIRPVFLLRAGGRPAPPDLFYTPSCLSAVSVCWNSTDRVLADSYRPHGRSSVISRPGNLYSGACFNAVRHKPPPPPLSLSIFPLVLTWEHFFFRRPSRRRMDFTGANVGGRACSLRFEVHFLQILPFSERVIGRKKHRERL